MTTNNRVEQIKLAVEAKQLLEDNKPQEAIANLNKVKDLGVDDCQREIIDNVISHNKPHDLRS